MVKVMWILISPVWIFFFFLSEYRLRLSTALFFNCEMPWFLWKHSKVIPRCILHDLNLRVLFRTYRIGSYHSIASFSLLFANCHTFLGKIVKYCIIVCPPVWNSMFFFSLSGYREWLLIALFLTGIAMEYWERYWSGIPLPSLRFGIQIFPSSFYLCTNPSSLLFINCHGIVGRFFVSYRKLFLLLDWLDGRRSLA